MMILFQSTSLISSAPVISCLTCFCTMGLCSCSGKWPDGKKKVFFLSYCPFPMTSSGQTTRGVLKNCSGWGWVRTEWGWWLLAEGSTHPQDSLWKGIFWAFPDVSWERHWRAVSFLFLLSSFLLQFPGGRKKPHVAPYGPTYKLLKENVAWLSFQPGFSGLWFYFIYKLT